MDTSEYQSVFAVIPAAGESSRLKSSLEKNQIKSKIFLPLNDNLSVLHQTLQNIWDSGIRNLILSTQKDFIDKVENIASQIGEWQKLVVLEGGKSRFESVGRCLEYVSSNLEINSSNYVLVHDAARPFCSPVKIKEALDVSIKESIGVILAVPVTGTIKEVKNGIIVKTPPRHDMWEAQTPQIFPLIPFLKAYDAANKTSNTCYDDASVYEASNQKVKIIQGEYENIKITTTKDLKYIKTNQ